MDQVRTIIFLQEEQFNARDYARFGVAPLQREGFRIEAWNLSPVLHPDVLLLEQQEVSLPGGFTPTRFASRGEFLRALDDLKPTTLVICLIHYSLSTFFIYRALSKREIPYAIHYTNILPLPERITGTIRLDVVRKIFSLIMDTLILRFYPFLGVQPACLCIVGGEKSLDILRGPIAVRNGKTDVLPVHTLDYDLYLDLKRSHPEPVEENFAVFLDSNDFYHLDLRYQKEPVPAWMDTYFSDLRRFLDRLERDLGTRTVIAAHPRAQYTPEQEAQFGGREVIKGRTADLVRRCRLVILHASTAVNHAVLFGKPVLFLTNHNYERYVVGPYIEAIAKALGKVPVSLDSPDHVDWVQILRVEGDAYTTYRRLYIKTDGSEDRPSWEILAKFLKTTD